MNYDELFQTLASDDGRIFKINLLNEHKDDTVLKEIIRLALDPMTQFYIRKIPKYEPNLTDHAASIGSMLPALNDLSNRVVTGHAAIDHLTMILQAVNAPGAKVIERIIQKDLRCGVSTSTANKVWKDLVPEYPCMLCSQYDTKLAEAIQFPAYAQMKMDGMRFNAIVRKGGVEFRSRNGKELHLLGELESEFIALANGVDCVFDGELVVAANGIRLADRKTGNGVLNKANKGTISLTEAKSVRASLWDVIPYDDFVKGVCKVPYQTRWETILQLVDSQPTDNRKIWSVFCVQVPTLDIARDVFNTLLADGCEGIILKDMRGIWENKRTKSQVKFKAELECELRVVAVQEGTGKYEGMMGAVLCESEDGVIKVGVGSGFTDEQRKEGMEVGTIITVKYNERIINKQGEESLFLPVFVEVRLDKDVADSSKVIA
jgi:hypothetical protein